MQTKTIFRIFLMLMALFNFLLFNSPAEAKETVRYSSSAQVMAAVGDEILKALAEDTGVETDLFIGSSDAVVHRMMNGQADVASSVERIAHGSVDYGYIETFFARAPLILITNASTTVRDLTTRQIRDIFNGSIDNWKDVGGPDKKIVVVIPAKNTGAFKNYSMLVLKRFDVKFDYMAYRSTDVVDLVRHIPWSISFITKGAHTAGEAIKTINIDGIKPEDKNYPYFQDFSFVTNGQPKGASKKFIDFFFSEKAKSIFRKSGLIPIEK